MKTDISSCIINDMAIQRDIKVTLRLSVAERQVMDEIGRRTGSSASTVMRQALLEKGERMGVHLKEVKAPTRVRGK